MRGTSFDIERRISELKAANERLLQEIDHYQEFQADNERLRETLKGIDFTLGLLPGESTADEFFHRIALLRVDQVRKAIRQALAESKGVPTPRATEEEIAVENAVHEEDWFAHEGDQNG